MVLSVEGLIVAGSIFLISYLLGAPLIIGLLASLPFGSTAFAALPAIGGSTPLIYTLFAAFLILAVVVRKHAPREISTIFTQFPAAWIALGLSIYAVVSAFVFPRLFLGQTTAFVVVEGAYVELPLVPVSQNITQTAYFILGILTFFSISILLLKQKNMAYLRKGLFAFVIINIALALLDVGGKLSGAGDILLPIRTAAYEFLTEVVEAGFFRISGGYPEASAFAQAGLSGLAFTYAYWRMANSLVAFILCAILLTLLLFSTSSTAYGALALLALFPLFSLVAALVWDRFQTQDLLLVLLGVLLFTVLLATYLYDQRIFDPFIELIDTMVLDKATSGSGIERAYWNERSLQAFADTGGVGIGMGSSRSSSWLVSVLSQLGIVGAIAMLSLLFVILRGMGRLQPSPDTTEYFAIAAGLRAAVIAMLIALSLAGNGADPGIIFFIALGGILACRRHVRTQTVSIVGSGQ
jgi:hypothetical protein